MPELAQQHELVDVSQLQHHPMNPRRGNVDAIASSISENGFYGTLVVQRSSGYVLAGNHRLRAARKLGIERVPVTYVDVDDDRARRILAVDNRSNDLATYDDDELIELLRSFDGELDGTGFTNDDLVKLLEDDDALQYGDAETDDSPVVFGVVIECRDEQQQSDLLDRLSAEGLNVRALM